MALPSSISGGQVAGIQGPGFVPLSNIRANPAAMDSAFATGMAQADSISDHVLLRPRQVASLAATADYQRTKALSDTGMVAPEADARMQLIRAINAQNADAKQAAEDALEDRIDPGLVGRRLHMQAGATQDDLDKANADVVAAHKQIDIATKAADAGGDPIEVQKAQQALEKAVDKSGKMAAAAQVAKSNLLVYTANVEALKNKARKEVADTGVDARTAEGTADDRVQVAEDAARMAAIRSTDDRDFQQLNETRFAQDELRRNTLQTAAKVGRLEAVKAGVAPSEILEETPSTPVSLANERAAVATQVTNALVAQAQLQATAAAIANGGFTGTVTQKLEDEIRAEAGKLGVSSIVPGTNAKKPLAEVSKEYAEKVNVKGAEPQTNKIRDEAKEAQTSLNALNSIKGLGEVNTGAVYTIPGVQTMDKILAQAGVEQSQKREAYSAYNRYLIPLVRLPGTVTNYEDQKYTQSLPGPGVSEATNANMLKGLLFVAQRTSGKPAFYDALVGPLPVNEVDKLWAQYMETNPSLNEDNSFNDKALTPQQYSKLISSAPGVADKEVAALASKQKVNTLPLGNSPAALAAAPVTAPFLAAPNAKGTMVPIVNPKFWAPIIETATKVRGTVTPAAPRAQVDPAAVLNQDPMSYLRPVGPVGATPPNVPLDAIRPRGP